MLKKYFFILILSSPLMAGEITLRYKPETGKIVNYNACLNIRQNLKELNRQTPPSGVPVFADIEIKAVFSLEISTAKRGYKETYTLNSITASLSADGYSENYKNLAEEYKGQSWSVFLSSRGEILSDKSGFISYASPAIYGRKLSPGREFKTESKVSYPILGMLINVSTNNVYKLKKITAAGLCFFDFRTYVETSSHYPVRKKFMADGDITGTGRGSFTYNSRRGIIEEAAAEFSLASEILSQADGKKQLLKLIQSIEIAIGDGALQ